MFFDIEKYKSSESLFSTLYNEIKKNAKKIPFRKDKCNKKCTLFSFSSSNLS